MKVFKKDGKVILQSSDDILEGVEYLSEKETTAYLRDNLVSPVYVKDAELNNFVMLSPSKFAMTEGEGEAAKAIKELGVPSLSAKDYEAVFGDDKEGILKNMKSSYEASMKAKKANIEGFLPTVTESKE